MFLSLYMGCGMLKKDWSHGQVRGLSGTTWGLTPSQPEKCVMKINDPNPRLTTFLGLTATWCACLRAALCYRAVTCGSVPSWCVLTFIFSWLRWCWSEHANPDWNCQRLKCPQPCVDCHRSWDEVRPEGRSTILAWESALESTFACILGNAMAAALDANYIWHHLALLWQAKVLHEVCRNEFPIRKVHVANQSQVGFLAEQVFGYRWVPSRWKQTCTMEPS